MHKRLAIAAMAALVGCGGGSSWVDPTTGNFSAQDSAQVMGMVSGAFSAALQRQPGPQTLKNALTESVSVTQSCALSGTVSVNGSMDSSCSPSGACGFSGTLNLALASCSNTSGYVGDGGLSIYARGSTSSTTFSLTETIQGGITVTHDGATIGTCGINVTVDLSSDGTTETVHVNGTICRQPVVQ
jgi:hypothetical protein